MQAALQIIQGVIFINRQQRRKVAKETGIDFDTVSLIDERLKAAVGYYDPIVFNDGDEVRINTAKILKRRRPTNEEYVKFITENDLEIFTVVKEDKYEGKPVVSLKEDPHRPRFLFFEDDLISITAQKEAVAIWDEAVDFHPE